MPIRPMPRARSSGLRDVGDVRARGAEVRGGDAARRARDEEPDDALRDAEAEPEARHADRGGQHAPEQTGRRPTRSETRPQTGTKRNCISE